MDAFAASTLRKEMLPEMPLQPDGRIDLARMRQDVTALFATLPEEVKSGFEQEAENINAVEAAKELEDAGSAEEVVRAA